MLRCSVKGTGFSIPFASFSFTSLQRVTVCHHISTGLYFGYRVGYLFVARMCSPSEQHYRTQTEVGHGCRWFNVTVRARIQIGGTSSFTSLLTTRRRPTYSESLADCMLGTMCRSRHLALMFIHTVRSVDWSQRLVNRYVDSPPPQCTSVSISN
jgi:hypothetical protein